MKAYIKRGDLVIIAAVLLIAGLIYLPLFFSKGGKTAEILVNGEVAERIALDRVTEAYTLEIPGSEILVEPGRIGYLHSDCPNGDCARFGMLSRAGSTAACVPNRTMIRIVPDGSASYDAVTY